MIMTDMKISASHHPPPATCLHLAAATQIVSILSMEEHIQEEFSFPWEAFGQWKALSLWKLWLLEGSKPVEALMLTLT